MKRQRTIQITSAGENSEDGWARIDWHLLGLDSGRLRLSYSLPEPDRDLIGDRARADSVVCAALLKAMECGRDLVVEGGVSPKLLDGLETLQDIWLRWRPRLYQRIRIRAEEETEGMPLAGERRAIFAFSGGVDASFSLFRHLKGNAGRNNRTPGAALLVHGMDIPLSRQDLYRRITARAERMLDGSGVRLVPMRTNVKGVGGDWRDRQGLQLVSCLLNLQASFEHAIIASSDPYDELTLPHSSTPLTDPLCSTGIMTMQHDGCAFDRTEKVKWLAENTAITDHLRVCWAGPSVDRNCGQCEKCVRTMLNFWALGLPAPAAFPTELSPRRVRAIDSRSHTAISELKALYRHAQYHVAESDPIMRAVQAVLRRAKWTDIARDASHLLMKR